MKEARRHPFVLALIVVGTSLGLAGTDLVLPAVPSLPRVLGGTLEQSQLVLAAFSAGAALGLLVFGELGARWDQRLLLVGSLLGYGALSCWCMFSSSLRELTALRFFQGAAGSAAAVFAPGMLRALYDDDGVVGAFGVLGSVESLVPALAPVAGLWLLEAFGWAGSFLALAGLGLGLALIVGIFRARLPHPRVRAGHGGYGRLLSRWSFLRQALSHAFTLGGLLVIVFGAPTVITTSLHGTLQNFIHLQLAGVCSFVVSANLAGALSRRWGAATLIMGGTVLSAVGAMALLCYAAAGGSRIDVVTLLFLPINMGLGFRGPPGFHAALLAADGDDARAAATVIVAILLTTAIGTAVVAPFIERGLISIASVAAVLLLAAVCLLSIGPGGSLAAKP